MSPFGATQVTGKTVGWITRERETIVRFIDNALALHADKIMTEIVAFDTCRAHNATLWAQLANIKSITSPGVKLDTNIAFARDMIAAWNTGRDMRAYDDAEDIRARVRYGGRSVGANINNACAMWNGSVATMSHADMTWETLATWNDGKAYSGHALKTRSWSLAVYDARSRVFTLDVHMLRGLASMARMMCANISDAAYLKLAAFMLDICDTEFPQYPPLVVQWAMWNEFRHAGKHASHIALAHAFWTLN